VKEELNCIIIDDDDLDRLAIEAEVASQKGLKLTGSFANPIEAFDTLQAAQPDVLFLDIDMPELNGLDFVRQISALNTINVIISSHPEYALEGFRLSVFDFIVKPLETDRFEQAVKRIYDFAQLKNKAHAYDVLFEKEKILFKEGYNVIHLNANEVIYLEAYGDYTKIVTEKKSHLTLATLGSFLEALPAGKFMRVHRSYVVAVNKVKSVNHKCIDMGLHVIPVGKTYIKETKRMFNAS